MNEQEAQRLRALAQAVEQQDRVIGQFCLALVAQLEQLAAPPAPQKQATPVTQASQAQPEGATS